MKKIGPKNSSPELIVRGLIKSIGFKCSFHRKDLPGSPDFVFIRKKKVIFVNGCFWHGHVGCRKSGLPQTNTVFWAEKICRNMLRDRRVCRQLNRMGWRYICIWQCRIKKGNEEALKKRIRSFLSSK